MTETPQILIIDDEIRMCESIKILLGGRNYRIQTSSSAREAMGWLENNHCDLILLDLMMPGMDGFQFLDHVKTRYPEITVIMMTGHTSIESAVEALKRGAHDYFGKPFEHDELVKRVENALDQRRLRAERDIFRRKLETSEERYRYLVHHSPDIIFTLGAKGEFLFVNDTVENLLGYESSSLQGKAFSTIVHGDDRDKVRAFFEAARKGKPLSDCMEVRLCYRTSPAKGSDCCIVELRASAMEEFSIEKNGKIRGIYGVARDITGSRRAEEEKKLLEAQLRQAQKMEAIGTLAGGIAHDFNNLLMAIQGNASLMLFDLDDKHEHYERLRNIEKLVDSGSRLTSQLLGYARKGRYEVRPIDLNLLVQDACETFNRTKKEIRVIQQFDKHLAAIEADSGQIEQVLMNLLVNAADAMRGGGTVSIRTSNATHEDMTGKLYNPKPGKYVLLQVSDTGVGMDEKTKERIFEPFFTTKEMGRGTGLGLASTYGIIKGHGGFIDVESQPGKGATFTIYLPASTKKVSKHHRGHERIVRGQETVLLIDDEDMVLEIGRALLETMGYQVITAKDGDEAISLYERQGTGIDLVLLDVVMPGLGGGEVFDRLKTMNPEMKCLLLSGYSIDGEATEILQRGCDGFIQKPFKLRDLSKSIREILHHP
ncbi:MAG TPA: response regulator [Syntrophales bacterium]|nr:response regulator [Syntrophales bacterium]